MRQSTSDPEVGLYWLQELRKLGGDFKQAVIEPKPKRKTPKIWPPLVVPGPRLRTPEAKASGFEGASRPQRFRAGFEVAMETLKSESKIWSPKKGMRGAGSYVGGATRRRVRVVAREMARRSAREQREREAAKNALA